MKQTTLEEYQQLVEEQSMALLDAIQTVALGDLDVQVEVPEGVEVLSELAIGLEIMIDDLRELLPNLERRSRDLQTAAEVSRAVGSILDPDELIQQVVNLARQRFGLYYAGLFLVDQTGEWTGEPGKWAVLRAGTGKAGQKMIAEGHKLEIGGDSMIGSCVASAQARIALDVGAEARRFDNPHLPKTRSEMALPLLARGQVIGAMTIQSEQEAAFSDEDIAILQTMADQVATAIANAHLFDEQQRARSLLDIRVKQLDCLNDIGRKIDKAPPIPQLLEWVVERIPPAMRYPDICQVAIEFDGQLHGAAEAANLSRQIVGSLSIGGERVGQMTIAYTEDHDFFDEESALLGDIVRRISGYLENQHLLQQIQERTAQLEWLTLIESTLSQASNEEEILTVITMGTDLEQLPSRISLQYLETDENEQPSTLYTVATWYDGIILSDDPELYQRYEVRDLPTSKLWLDASDETHFISDVQADPRADEQIREQAAQLGFQAIALMPLHSAGHWQGLVTFLWSEPHTFSSDEHYYLRQLLEPVSAVVASRRAYLAQQEARDESERRALKLQTAAEVSRAVGSILDPDELIQQVVNLACQRFGLYYAGLFLVDQTGEWTGEPGKWAVLRAGTGKAGQKMIAEGHKLEIGGDSMIGSCVASAQARIALDVGAEARRFDNPHLPKTRSEMALPLLARGQVIGAMTIQSEQEAAFSDEDIAILQTMADQVATAIQNGRLYQESFTLYMASQAVSQATTIEEALESIARYIAGPLYDTCTLLAFPSHVQQDMDVEGQHDTLEVLATWEKQTLASTVPLAVGTVIDRQSFPLFKFITRQEIVIFDDLSQDDQIDPKLARQIAASGVKSALSIPLVAGPNWIGLFVAQGSRPTALEPEDRRAFESLANQLAAFIQNVRLLKETQQSLEEIQRLHRSYIRESWQEYLRSTDESTAADYLFEKRQIVPNPDLQRLEIDLALQHNRTFTSDMLPGTGADTLLQSIDPTKGRTDGERSTVVVPISLRGQVIGAVGIEDPNGERDWNEDDIALLEAVTTQLGLAIDNARLSEQTRASLTETQTLFQTSRSLAAAQEMEEIWQAVVDAARQRRADACALFLFDTLERENARQLVLASGWDRQGSPRLPIGTRMPLNNFRQFDTLRPDQPFPVTDLAQAEDVDESLRDLLTALGFSALLHQPVAVRGRWFGLLTILYESPHAFAEAETNFYRTLADQAALAIEGRRLLTETQRRAEREQLIRQITDKVRATSDLERILQTTVQELSKAMGLPRAFIRLGTEQELRQRPEPAEGLHQRPESAEGLHQRPESAEGSTRPDREGR